jgi:hypothetical protein
MPAWSGARPNKLLGLVAQKGGLSQIAWRAPCPSDTLACPAKIVAKKGGLSRYLGGLVPIQCLGPPNQVVVKERWVEQDSLEDSCPSYAQAHPTKMEAQKGWAEPGSLEDSCPSDVLAHPTKIEMQKGGMSQVVWRTRALPMP